MTSISQPTVTTSEQMGSALPAPPGFQAQTQAGGDVAVSEFSDDTGVVVGTSNPPSLLDYITRADESLEAFFSRPVVVHTSTWASSAYSAASFDPWSVLMANPFLKKKYDNYAMFRGTLHLRATFNGTPMQAGALQLSYAPTKPAGATGQSYVCVPPNWNVWRGSQFRNIEIYGNGSSSGEIVAPFFFRKPFAGLTSGDNDITLLGSARIQQLVPLTSSSNAVVVPGTVQIFAWLTDVDIRVATFKNAMHRSPVAEKEAKPNFNISRPATMVAKAASMLRGLPIIGPYATVASTVAGGVASVAEAFGFAKPFDLRDKMVMVPRMVGGFALTEGVDSPEKLSTDPKQGVSIGGGWAGLPAEPDPMSIASIASRESLFRIDASSWSTATAVGTNLAVLAVYPNAFNILHSTNVYDVVPISYAAMPFAYWTGSVTIRVKAIASGMSRGRLLVWHYPHNDALYATATYDQIVNTCQNCILDLESSTDVEFVVKPSMTQPWLTIGNPADTGVDPVQGFPRGNGQVIVTVINALSAPLASTVGLMYYVRGGSDFQVAVPDMRKVSAVRWLNAMMPADPVDSAVPPSGPGGMAAPNAQCDLTGRPQREVPVEPFFGERIESFRSLAKRFSLYASLFPVMITASPAGTTQQAMNIGFDFYGTPVTTMPTATLPHWTWATWGLLPWLGVRGGMRYRAIMSPMPGSASSMDCARFGWTRSTHAAGSGALTGRVSVGPSTASFRVPVAAALLASPDGMSLTIPTRQPVAEAEFPYYSNDLFSFLGSSAAPVKHPEWPTLWSINGYGAGATLPTVTFDVYQAAADDISAFEWCGVGRISTSSAVSELAENLASV